MRRLLQTDWPFFFILVLLTVFQFWGIQYVPFHPDESTQLYMSSDFEALLSNPSTLFWRLELEGNPRQHFRALDAPITKYLLGLGRKIAGRDALAVDWDWSKSWNENIHSGAYPDPGLLQIGRSSITILLPLSLIFVYLIGKRLKGRSTGLLTAILLGTQAVVLLHGRRAMAEGTLLMGVTLAMWTILTADKRPWLAGLGFAIAFNSKQSSLALLPAALIALCWFPKGEGYRLRKILIGVLQFSLVFFVITFILNPLYWSNPLEAIRSSVSVRQELVAQQIQDTIAIAPEKYLATPAQRVLMLIVNLFISPPEYGLVGNLSPTLKDVDAYIAIPGHNLFRGIIWGGVFLVLTMFGVYMAIRNISRFEKQRKRDITLIILATFSMAAGLIAVVPLTWVRYSVPMVPFACLWMAYGITALELKKGKAKESE
jgi:4-amino-4-deoxy-L-arabinose transferase-like glycosyltransferase